MTDQLLSSYDYSLPPELIAQSPAVPRDSSRLLVVASKAFTHSRFRELPSWLLPGDLLVLNNTRVIPARLYGRKSTGAPVEILLLEERQPHCWLALVKPGKRFKRGTEIIFSSPDGSLSLPAQVVDRDEATGGRLLQFQIPPGETFEQLLSQIGQIPLPPYILQSYASDSAQPSSSFAPEQYQTVYAQQAGSVAAPTAGLHFTEELLQRLEERGVQKAWVTLHVGVGTFRPVEVEDVTTHTMHTEWVEVPAATVEQFQATKARGGRVIAVGTTAVRALEGAVRGEQLTTFCGKTDLFIYPGYRFKAVDGLITNFHLPRSSLLMLVSALIGRERLLRLYQEAIQKQYRFYSFGDAMLILPEAKI
ncbi:MAG: tRNA preQ1(34) S-adenosylmethionine ribosyltransferase-isomerase QueA [Cyanophyceae cyanobacterium]